MSFFGKIFGGGGKQKTAWDTNEAIQNIRKMEEMLIKKQEFLEQKIDNEIDVAKKNGSKNKRGTVIQIIIIFFLLLRVLIHLQKRYRRREREGERK